MVVANKEIKQWLHPQVPEGVGHGQENLGLLHA